MLWVEKGVTRFFDPLTQNNTGLLYLLTSILDTSAFSYVCHTALSLHAAGQTEYIKLNTHRAVGYGAKRVVAVKAIVLPVCACAAINVCTGALIT